jgi:CheY-like chemotaxis protein
MAGHLAEAVANGGLNAPAWCVLHVDDDELELVALRRAFRKLLPDCEIEMVTSGADALARLATEPRRFSAVIADINMPGIGGLELVTRLRQAETSANIPIVVFSSSNLERDRTAASACGASAYFVKELNEGTYRRLAAWVLRQRRQETAAVDAGE